MGHHYRDLVNYYNTQGDPDAEYLAAILAYSPLAFYDASLSDIWEDSAGTIAAADDGDVVGRWDDLSGNGYHLSQATTGNKPLLKLNIQNGRRVTRFDGTDDRLPNTAIAQAQPTTIFTVFKFASIASDTFIYDNATGGTGRHAMFSETGLNGVTIFAGGSVTSPNGSLDTVMNLWTAKFNGASSAIYKNAGAAVTGDTGAGAISRHVLGTNQGQNQHLNGDVCTHIIFAGALSDTDRAAIRDLINARWAVY